jgi:indolepyruvate ferredoxin oxidoreductase beta subunit
MKGRKKYKQEFTADRTTGVLLAGVGGQGIILASEILSEVALEAGLDVKKSEVHGMAQRGGSVVSHVRFGPEVASPLITEGQADFLVSFEEMEGLRYLPLLKRDGRMIINRQRIYTLAMLMGEVPYPEEAIEGLDSLPIRLEYVDGPSLSSEVGNPRTANVAVLGRLAGHLDFKPALWSRVIEKRVPARYLEVNLKAFFAGMERSVPPGQKNA